MKKIKNILIFIILIASSIQVFSQTANNFSVELARYFSKDIFELNGVNFLQPVVRVVNSTSNVGFYHNAYIPHKVDKPYFKFSVEMMFGLTPESEKSYSPKMPNTPYNSDDLQNLKLIQVGFDGIKIDTVGLIHYFFLNLMYDGINRTPGTPGSIVVPKKAPTAMGNNATAFELRATALDSLIRSHPAYSLMEQLGLADTVLNSISSFPQIFNLPPGGNINSIQAGVPQLVIGSLFGTELLLRYIPKINLGENIGDFTFWGVGLSHSLSQYIDEPPFEAAIQSVYQSTNLSNKVGVTNAELNAKANMINVNLHLSKNIKSWFDVYAGFSYEKINIKSTYKYYLPVEIQWQLKLLEHPNYNPTPGYPGDVNPQIALVNIDDSQYKFSFGISKEYYNFIGALNLNISQVTILGASIGYRF